jgi:hypothetical protein
VKIGHLPTTGIIPSPAYKASPFLTGDENNVQIFCTTF